MTARHNGSRPASAATPPPERPIAHADAPRSSGNLLAVLRCFDGTNAELRAADLARRLDMKSSTLYRYLGLLEDQGFLVRVPGTSRYALGLALIELGGVALARLEPWRQGQAILESLATEADANANLAVLDSGDTLHISYAVRSEVDRLYAVIGRRTPAHYTALGKVLLSSMPWDHVQHLIERYGWRRLPSAPSKDLNSLREDLELTRERGFGIEMGELNPRMGCVAAPVRDSTGAVVAAMSISTNVERLRAEATRDSLITAVRSHAGHLSARLNYLGPAAF